MMQTAAPSGHKKEKIMFREVARTKQALSRAESIELLKTTKRGVLSVIGDDGYPYGTPLNHWYCEADGKLYFHSGKTGHRPDALRTCSKASFCVMDEGKPVEGAWWLQFRSVIVFGTIEVIEDQQQALEIARKLSYKFTQDEAYIQHEIEHSGAGVLVFALTIAHITGKRVTER